MKVLIKSIFIIMAIVLVVTSQATRPLACDINQEITTFSALTSDISPKVLKLAATAYQCAHQQGLDKKQILTVIDFTLPSYKKRLWVYNVSKNKLLFQSLVAHGAGSGGIMPTIFSDLPRTHESSVGLYLTGRAYVGSDGYSLKLFGLDKGFNDRAASRDIVIHGAWYVSENFARRYGRIGRSWGCPAVPLSEVKPLIDAIKNGTLLFIYYPVNDWLEKSKYLHC